MGRRAQFAHWCFVVGSVAWLVVVVRKVAKGFDADAGLDLVAAVLFLVGSIAMSLPPASRHRGQRAA